ncbi:DNA-binding transcriptional MerR regulator [Microbacteriaceae bacterium SG_E_30_P1]|uniref:DNA-binding transcriptional MerR regulator n=1 Tax=Antiquaquibacter oligotrophicus TaxID=2880260 RepID=A0ABT6KRE8_9MICO|nr:MerR family transcriptional regulator [Antiquaquibacter oligotrophicus]MDH6182540.1 DNA-binding transcriptional MerR regulator [Antiquaquibacter oligotrophicus]UDF14491.1 MerR family transcriptional regulator [Antiquaquibacter oligotrophicus]
MDWPIQQIARLAGTTSRTLRHYDNVGLVSPSRIGDNGYRYYDERALVRLQRVLMLRDLGLGIPAIADVLAGQRDDVHALRTHLDWLQQERNRIDRQIASVEKTIADTEGGEQLMAETMFDGFDHTQYKEEVEGRWGAKAYADSDRWWRGLTAQQQQEWKRKVATLSSDWAAAAASGADPAGGDAQALAARHAEWLGGVPGTPGVTREYLLGLGDMYVADGRFGANYGGTDGATFVRDALRVYVDRNL